jgi:signal peptidase I
MKTLKVLAILMTFIVGVIIGRFIIHDRIGGFCMVVGKSMEPTYHTGDKLFFRAYPLIFRDPQKGEIVILKDNDGVLVIKRIALVPGAWDNITKVHHFLKQGEFVVLGDNKSNSLDSRFYGPVNKKQFRGIVK